MNIVKATAKYEAWLSRRIHVLTADLDFKHAQMRSAPFPFLRSTFYRWAQVWPEVCEEAARAPVVLAVGDLHIENFGTWRDSEGRLIWGINDFDEAWRLPYTSDLIRLATSALLAPAACGAAPAIGALLRGYVDGLETGGRPFALAEHHATLRTLATARMHAPEQFWEKLHALPEEKKALPAGARKAIEGMMPAKGLDWHISDRGAWRLGRERYGGDGRRQYAREAKALAPSACHCAEGTGSRRSVPETHTPVRCAILLVFKSAGSCGGWLRIARVSN
jgi:hypothetical protein